MRKKRLKGTSDFFFLGSSFHPSGATLVSLASGSAKKNSVSVGMMFRGMGEMEREPKRGRSLQ